MTYISFYDAVTLPDIESGVVRLVGVLRLRSVQNDGLGDTFNISTDTLQHRTAAGK